MGITRLAHLWVERFLAEGDLAVDATVGNGHDTTFLAKRIGSAGKVFGFDIQQVALDAARDRLAGERLLDRVELFHRSHTEMEAVLDEADERRRPKAILFNLGYLPGADKSVTTRTEETVRAAALGLNLLAPEGVMTVVLYPGHEEGHKELEAITTWAEALPDLFEATFSRPMNRLGATPCLVAVERRR